MTTVTPLHEQDWTTLKKIRLTALERDPEAFGSTLERELGFDEKTWRSRLTTSIWFLAVDDQVPCGIVAGRRADVPNERHLVSLWVGPEHRGRGIAAQLVAAVVNWARVDGGGRLLLWVMEDNEAAVRLYERLKLGPTGLHRPVPRNPPRGEIELALEL